LQPTPSTTKAIHGQNNATKLGNTMQAPSGGGHGIDVAVVAMRVQHGITRRAQLALCSIFICAWMKNGALLTPASSKEGSQGDSKMIQVWKHAICHTFCVHGIYVVGAVAAWNHQ
jgi:hypothetical protein